MRSASATVDGAVVRECIRTAVAAVSVHNTQPWLFRIRDDGVDVLVDRQRQLKILDPTGREMFVSVGAAVFNLRVAARARALDLGVELAPDPSDPDLAARIRWRGPAEVTAAARALAEAVGRRHTNRRPFADRPVPDDVLTDLTTAASVEGTTMLVADEVLRGGILSLTRTAENRLRSDPRYRTELQQWTTPGGVGRRDGVPRQALGPRATDAAIPMRELALGHGMSTAAVAFEPNPTIALLFSVHDTPADWLRAGGALQRILLTATVHGLAATPLSQLTEVPALRALVCDHATGQVQTVLRIGYPMTPAVATPRRSLDEVIIIGRPGDA